MWLLPLDPPSTACSLSPGRYLVPWWYAAEEAGRLAGLVATLVPDLEYRIEVPWAALPLASGAGLHQPHHTLVLLRVPIGVEPDDAEIRLQNLGGRYQLIQYGDPQDGGYGWQEQHLQEPLLSQIRRNLTDPHHPLADQGIANLPLNFAARMTTDVVELVALLTDAVSHRLRYAEHGVTSEEYRRSVRVVAGRRLSARLAQCPAHLQPFAAALVLAGADQIDQLEQPTAAARALEQVGLARHVAGDISIGPLARQCQRDDAVRGAFLDGLPIEARRHAAVRRWTVEQGMLSISAAPSPAAPMAVRRSGDALWREVRDGLDQAIATMAPQAPIDVDSALRDGAQLLGELVTLPSYQETPPPSVGALAVGRLRRLADVAAQVPRDLVQLHSVLTAVLQFLLARGPDDLTGRVRAVDAIGRAAGGGAPPYVELAYGAMVSEVAWDWLATASKREDLARVQRTCVDQLPRVPKQTAVAASLLGLEAHLAAKAGDNERAKQIHRRRIAIYTDLGAEREAAVTEARIARIEAAMGESATALSRHEAAMAVFERIGARHDQAVAMGDIARLRAADGQLREALKLHRERLSILQELGARHSRAIAMGDVARLLAHRGDLDEALALHEERLGIFEALGEVVGQAITLGDVARIKARRGELDEALSLQRRRLQTFASLDDLDGQAVAHLNIGQVQVQLGHLADAEASFRRALALNKRVGHAAGTARAGDELGRLLAVRGDREAAMLLEDAVARYERLGQTHRAAAARAVLERLRASP